VAAGGRRIYAIAERSNRSIAEGFTFANIVANNEGFADAKGLAVTKGFARSEELAGDENAAASVAKKDALIEDFSRVRIRPVAGATVRDW